MNKKVIICSGGTGGHVIPSVNFGNFLIKEGFDCILILDKRGKKYSNSFKGKVYVIHSAHLSGNFIFKIKSLFKLVIGFIESIIIIMRFRPEKVFTFGSYASFMPLLVIIFLKLFKKIDLNIHEQNSVIGKVNSFFLPFVNNCFTNFDTTKKINKKYSNKLIHVGLPLDVNYLKKKMTKIKESHKINIFIYGGSQGSEPLINKFILILKNIDTDTSNKFYLYVQANNKFHQELSSIFQKLNIRYQIRDFYSNIDEILSLTDIAITRAGAGTINDLIKNTIPAIIMPLPHSMNNHQYYNAKFLSIKNAAILFKENNFDIEINTKIFMQMINDKNKRYEIINALKKINLPNANKLMLLNIK